VHTGVGGGVAQAQAQATQCRGQGGGRHGQSDRENTGFFIQFATPLAQNARDSFFERSLLVQLASNRTAHASVGRSYEVLYERAEIASSLHSLVVLLAVFHFFGF